ncbi:MAG: DUF11 domain-containing protein, partial [Deltaproteobacteria bacterium]|nr:DUF11 domain-containing protein [Deltaproteobacteria bacterium]
MIKSHYSLIRFVFSPLFLLLCPPVFSQTMPAGTQEYIVMGRDEQMWRFMQHVATQEGSSDLDASDMRSVVTLTATLDGQKIIYDHWEDGYESDLLNPTDATTEVYIRARGQVLSLASDGSGGGINRVIPIPRVINDIDEDLRYDGGDRILSLGGPINVAHNMFPSDTTLIGGAWEMFSRKAMQGFRAYRIPVGKDSYEAAFPKGGNNGTFAPFQYVGIQVTAFENDTQVVIDNGSATLGILLQRGQSYYSGGGAALGYIDETPTSAISILENTLVSGDKEIQVGLLTGSDGNYQTRFFNVVPLKAYGRDYVLPVEGNLGDVNVYLFNPNLRDANVDVYLNPGATTVTSFLLPALSSTSFRDTSIGPLPDNTGARIVSDELIWGIVAYDYTGTLSDWGFSLVPSRFLKDDYFVSWAPASSNPNPPAGSGGSPVWITPVHDSTLVYVDRNNDGVWDDMDTDGDGTADSDATTPTGVYRLDMLEVLMIYDPVDHDNTGTRVKADGPIALAFGLNGRQSQGMDPGYDLGYTILPLIQDFLEPILIAGGSALPTSVPRAGGTSIATLTVQVGNFGVDSINLRLVMDPQVGYVPGSASVPETSIDTSSPTETIIHWDLAASLAPAESLSIDVALDWELGDPDGQYDFEVIAEGDYLGETFAPRDAFSVIKSFLRADMTATPSGPVTTGDTLTYTLTVSNTDASGGETASNASAIDYLHEGLDFDPTGNGTFDPATRSVSWSLADLPPQGSQVVDFKAIVRPLVEGTFIDNLARVDATDSSANPFSVESNTVSNQVLYPILDVFKDASPQSVGSTDTVTYTLAISNASSVAASNVILRDVIPGGTTYVTDSMYLDTTGTGAAFIQQTDDVIDDDPCDFDISNSGEVTLILDGTETLPAGAVYLLTFQVVLDGSGGPGDFISNQASIEADNAATKLSNSALVRIPETGCSADLECIDLISCTDDTCVATACVNTTNNANCSSDGAFCNGAEICDPVFDCISEGDPCTAGGEVCDEGGDACVECLADGDCIGSELCETTSHTCVECLADGDCVGSELCETTSHTCVECLVDGDCDNGIFCDGVETCSGNACVAGPGDPCTAGGQVCDDGGDACVECLADGDCIGSELCETTSHTCVECLVDGDCDNGIFCDGVETCSGNACVVGPGDPCTAGGQLCDETGDVCVECLNDGDCDNATFCDGV